MNLSKWHGNWDKQADQRATCKIYRLNERASSHCVKCKGADNGVVLLKTLVVIFAGSPSIIGAVIRRHWLQFHIWFISLLVAYSSLPAAAVLCLMPYALPSFLKCCSVGSANPLYQVLLIPTACLLFWPLAAPYIQWILLCMLG